MRQTTIAGSRRLSLVLTAVFAVLAAGPGSAVEPGEILPDAPLEARARKLSAELRCLVCQNQSIDDSNAPLARDLRVIVRERLVAGDTDAQVLAFVTQRYGEFVLLRPPFNWRTLALWLAPLVILIATVGFVLTRLRRTPPAAPPELDREEQRRLDQLLRQER